MKVVLISPPAMDLVGDRLMVLGMDATQECPPYGLYLLAAILRHGGHDVRLIDLTSERSCSIANHGVDLEDASLIGLGATSLSWATAVDVIRQVRRIHEHVPIVLGGVHPTMFDEYMLTVFPIQFVIRGEAEVALPALCKALEERLDLGAVPNLSWRSDSGRIVRNPIGTKLSGVQLAASPLPDYGSLPWRIYNGLPIESSRGCAFDCAFCSTSYRKTWRAMPAEDFVSRLSVTMQHLDRTKHGVVQIIDDEFSTNVARACDIATAIHDKGLAPKLIYNSRAHDFLDDAYADAIAPLTHQLLIGAECGYDEGLKRVGKQITCETLERAAAQLCRHGISERADFSFILGLPWESKAEVTKTINFATHLSATWGVRILLQWYLLLPGSRLWDEASRNQMVTEAIVVVDENALHA